MRSLITAAAILLASRAPVSAQQWTSLGTTGFATYTLAVDGAGVIYAAGGSLPFESERGHAAIYQNGTWVAINPPGFGSVQNLLLDRFTGGILAAGPNPSFFGPALSAFSNGIWTSLAAPPYGGGDGFAIDNIGTLYMSGEAPFARGVVERFANGAWTVLFPPGFDEIGGNVTGMAFDAANRLYVGGIEQVSPSLPCCVGRVRVLTGGSWSSIDPPGFGQVFRLRFDPTRPALFATGLDDPIAPLHGKVAMYSNGGWTELDPPGFSTVFPLVVDDVGVVYVGGTSYSPGAVAKVSRYADGIWTSMDPPNVAPGTEIDALVLDAPRHLLYATDELGNVFVTSIGTPAQRLADLIQAVANLGLPAGLATSLAAKLNVAQDSLARGNSGSAQNQLGAFVNEVEAQSGKALSPAQAATLITEAQNVFRP